MDVFTARFIEAAEVGILAASQQAMEVFGEDGVVALGVVDAGVVVVGMAQAKLTSTFERWTARARQ